MLGLHTTSRKLLFTFLFVLFAVLTFGGRARAANFNYTDHLMDDSVMRASSAMSAQDIQSFLAQKGSGLAAFSDVENCGSTSGAHYSYYATYYACGQSRSAAQIIYDAGRAYGINPQVLLATLQKEQSLITTPNPTSYQLNFAMGYGCPDSGSCSYPGFFNQLDNAAWQFRTYMELGSGNSWWGYPASSYPCNGATRYYSAALKAGNSVGFKDDAGTPYTTIVIPNIATGGLYCYTPHVYNNPQGLYGLPAAGSVGSYYSGSYNFVYYFNRWFRPFAWQLTGQYAYTDNTKTTGIGLNNLRTNQRVYIGFTAKNTGNETWSNSGPNPINVGTLRPTGRSSPFFDETWLGPNRPSHMKESTVAPGQTATFEFWIKAPANQSGDFSEYFGLLAESLEWMPDIGMYYGIHVAPDIYSWQPTSQYAYTDSSKTTPTSLYNMSPGQKVFVGLTAKNTGNVSWSNSGPNPVFLGTSHGLNRVSAFMNNAGWQSPIRAARMQESTVAPGQTATFEFWMIAPSSLGGSFREYFNLVSEGRAWMSDIGLNFSGSLLSPNYAWKLNYQYAFTDTAKTTPTGLSNLTPGQTALVGIKITNTGSTTWYQSGNYPLNIGTNRPVGRISPFYTAGWPGYGRPSHMLEPEVRPGQTATFEFLITAPAAKGSYLEYYSPVAEGIAWLPDIGLNFNIIVK